MHLTVPNVTKCVQEIEDARKKCTSHADLVAVGHMQDALAWDFIHSLGDTENNAMLQRSPKFIFRLAALISDTKTARSS